MGLRELLSQRLGVPVYDDGKYLWNVRGTLWAIHTDVANLSKEGGRVIKQVLEHCPPHAVHLQVSTPVCHQVSALSHQGKLGWTGIGSRAINECLLQSMILAEFLLPSAILFSFVETSGSIRHNPIHIQYLQEVANMEYVIRSAQHNHLAERVRFWAGPWKAAPQRPVTEKQIQGILEPGWIPFGKKKGGIDILIAPSALGDTIQKLNRDDLITVESVEPPLHKTLWWRVHIQIKSTANLAAFCDSDGPLFLVVEPIFSKYQQRHVKTF